ncbi:MAG: hypothetical protein QXO32_08365 [Candidatus Bathyarchaeia archaeon]
MTKALVLPYNTMFRVMRRLRKKLYLTVSTMSFKGILELDKVYVTDDSEGKKGFSIREKYWDLKRSRKGPTSWLDLQSWGVRARDVGEAHPHG